MRENERDRLKPDRPGDDPTLIPVGEKERLMREGVREAALWHQFKGVPMVVADPDGANIREVDPSAVLASLDAADAQEDAADA